MLDAGRLPVSDGEDDVPALQVDVGAAVGGLENEDPVGGPEVAAEVGVEGRELDAAEGAAEAHEEMVAIHPRHERVATQLVETATEQLELGGAVVAQLDPVAHPTGALIGEETHVGSAVAVDHRRGGIRHDTRGLPLAFVLPFHRDGVARRHPGRELQHPEPRR